MQDNYMTRQTHMAVFCFEYDLIAAFAGATWSPPSWHGKDNQWDMPLPLSRPCQGYLDRAVKCLSIPWATPSLYVLIPPIASPIPVTAGPIPLGDVVLTPLPLVGWLPRRTPLAITRHRPIEVVKLSALPLAKRHSPLAVGSCRPVQIVKLPALLRSMRRTVSLTVACRWSVQIVKLPTTLRLARHIPLAIARHCPVQIAKFSAPLRLAI